MITGLVDDTAVVTLTGPGGVGKTRLALQVAAELHAGLPDGAWLVDLAPVNHAERVAAVVLETLGYTLAAGEDEVLGLCARLRRRRLLLVLDNCEHLIASVATLVDAISTSAPDVRVIATSREGLGVPAERVVPVTPLTTDADGDAVELFVTRARAGATRVRARRRSTPTVVELCRRLDGIPLAIELAAARARSIAPAKILERLDERFRMLTGGSRTAVARHQTLQAAVDWSYELLSDAERVVLDRLSVFAGGFTLDAAELVAADDEIDAFDVLDHVSALVDKSLVVADPGNATYRLLETIRQYAAGRLAESGAAEAVRARHAEHYRTLAITVAPELTGADDLAAMARLADDIENLRLMLDWYRDHGQGDVVAHVISELGLLWFWRGDRARDDRATRLDHRHAGRRPRARSRVHAMPRLDELGRRLLAASRSTRNGRPNTRPVPGCRPRCQRSTAWAPTTWCSSATPSEPSSRPSSSPPRRSTQRRPLLGDVGPDSTASSTPRCSRPAPTRPCAWRRSPAATSNGREASCCTRTGSRAQRSRCAPSTRSVHLHCWRKRTRSPPVRTSARGSPTTSSSAVSCSTPAGPAPPPRAWRRSLVGNHDMGNRRGMLNVLSAVVGVTDRSGRPDAAASSSPACGAAREEYGIPGSAIERHAEQRVEELILLQLGDDAADARGAPLDDEATIDLALDTLDAIAADEPA